MTDNKSEVQNTTADLAVHHVPMFARLSDSTALLCLHVSDTGGLRDCMFETLAV